MFEIENFERNGWKVTRIVSKNFVYEKIEVCNAKGELVYSIDTYGNEKWYKDFILICRKYPDGRIVYYDDIRQSVTTTPNNTPDNTINNHETTEKIYKYRHKDTSPIKNNSLNRDTKCSKKCKKRHDKSLRKNFDKPEMTTRHTCYIKPTAAHGTPIHTVCSSGFEVWHLDGKVIRRNYPDGHQEYFNRNGELIKYVYSDNSVELFEDGRIVYFRDSDKTRIWYNPDGSISRRIDPGVSDITYGEDGSIIESTYKF